MEGGREGRREGEREVGREREREREIWIMQANAQLERERRPAPPHLSAHYAMLRFCGSLIRT